MTLKPPSMKDIMWSHYEATLRDDFAKSALTGLISAYYSEGNPTTLALKAYEIADLMLIARRDSE